MWEDENLQLWTIYLQFLDIIHIFLVHFFPCLKISVGNCKIIEVEKDLQYHQTQPWFISYNTLRRIKWILFTLREFSLCSLLTFLGEMLHHHYLPIPPHHCCHPNGTRRCQVGIAALRAAGWPGLSSAALAVHGCFHFSHSQLVLLFSGKWISVSCSFSGEWSQQLHHTAGVCSQP